MVLMSMPSSLRPMSGANFPPIAAWKVHATSARLAGKYRWQEFPAVITVLGNTPNFAKVGNTAKYEILELFFAKIVCHFSLNLNEST